LLIEFSVSNFRSFREKQTFSMAAAPRLGKRANTFAPKAGGEKLPALLKVAAVYGPNASGKSAFVLALSIVSAILKRKPGGESRALPVQPFRFDAELREQPSRFEYHFVHAGVRYLFELALTSARIVEERLTVFPRGRGLELYSRRHESSGDIYKFGASLEGTKELHNAWKDLTGPQTLFLAQAVANSSESLTQLRLPHSWFGRLQQVNQEAMNHWARSMQKLVHDDAKYADLVAEFLQEFDVPVTGLRSEVDPLQAPVQFDPEATGIASEITRKDGSSPRTMLTHSSALGSAEFSLSEESQGTQNLIGFWLPWSLMADAESEAFCSILVVDELDSSLHPNIVEALVREQLKISKEVQLIFTTHDTHLMNTRLLRRDQFWLTERDENGATNLRSVHDFVGREGEDLEKRYYEGRYRSLPIVGKR
jgi:hypothetical protein